MKHPAIVYNVGGLLTEYADNIQYNQTVEYDVTLMHDDPDNPVWRALGRLTYVTLDRTAVVDNLYHYYYSLRF